MRNRLNRERWLHDVEARQRSVVFPDTVQNEGRFWRNLGKQGWTTMSKIGLVVLGLFSASWRRPYSRFCRRALPPSGCLSSQRYWFGVRFLG